MRVRYTAARKTELYESDTKFPKVGRTFKKLPWADRVDKFERG
jgi:hypothetical protein